MALAAEGLSVVRRHTLVLGPDEVKAALLRYARQELLRVEPGAELPDDTVVYVDGRNDTATVSWSAVVPQAPPHKPSVADEIMST